MSCEIKTTLAGVGLNFDPIECRPVGVLIQRAVLRILRIFHVELRPPETGGNCITTPSTDKIWTRIEL